MVALRSYLGVGISLEKKRLEALTRPKA